jgi:hypothetical protein
MDEGTRDTYVWVFLKFSLCIPSLWSLTKGGVPVDEQLLEQFAVINGLKNYMAFFHRKD